MKLIASSTKLKSKWCVKDRSRKHTRQLYINRYCATSTYSKIIKTATKLAFNITKEIKISIFAMPLQCL